MIETMTHLKAMPAAAGGNSNAIIGFIGNHLPMLHVRCLAKTNFKSQLHGMNRAVRVLVII